MTCTCKTGHFPRPAATAPMALAPSKVPIPNSRLVLPLRTSMTMVPSDGRLVDVGKCGAGLASTALAQGGEPQSLEHITARASQGKPGTNAQLVRQLRGARVSVSPAQLAGDYVLRGEDKRELVASARVGIGKEIGLLSQQGSDPCRFQRGQEITYGYSPTVCATASSRDMTTAVKDATADATNQLLSRIPNLNAALLALYPCILHCEHPQRHGGTRLVDCEPYIHWVEAPEDNVGVVSENCIMSIRKRQYTDGVRIHIEHYVWWTCTVCVEFNIDAVLGARRCRCPTPRTLPWEGPR